MNETLNFFFLFVMIISGWMLFFGVFLSAPKNIQIPECKKLGGVLFRFGFLGIVFISLIWI